MRSKAFLKSINKAKLTFFCESVHHVADQQRDICDQNEQLSEYIIYVQTSLAITWRIQIPR